MSVNYFYNVWSYVMLSVHVLNVVLYATLWVDPIAANIRIYAIALIFVMITVETAHSPPYGKAMCSVDGHEANLYPELLKRFVIGRWIFRLVPFHAAKQGNPIFLLIP